MSKPLGNMSKSELILDLVMSAIDVNLPLITIDGPISNIKPDLIIRVDWFKQSGKWYAGGKVNIGTARLWMSGNVFKQAIVDNQHILNDYWQDGDLTVVTQDRI